MGKAIRDLKVYVRLFLYELFAIVPSVLLTVPYEVCLNYHLVCVCVCGVQ